MNWAEKLLEPTISSINTPGHPRSQVPKVRGAREI